MPDGMRRTGGGAAVVLAATMLWAAGCQTPGQRQQFTATVLNPLNLELPFLPYQEPVRVGIVHRQTGIFDPATWDVAKIGSPWTPLQMRLQKKLGRPVQIEQFKPFQVAAHLQSGRLDFAFLAAGDYVDLTQEFGELGRVIAVSDVLERRGLIVAKAKSDIRDLADVRGKRFAFGPSGDPVLDAGAKRALAAAGVAPEDLQKELLPIPDAFQYHISSNEAAYEVVHGLGTDVGVIEKADYAAYPETGGNLLLRKFSKADFRVLGETEPHRVETISTGPFIASREADPQLVEDVREFLIGAATAHRSALATMGLSRFQPAPADVDQVMRRVSQTGAVHLAGESN
jgi:ABC-type phosphate/phosphonate transport system substrate-binding protein